MAHAWAWFSLHSDQRMRLTNFWLVAMAFLVAAYAQALAGDRDGVAGAVALAGAFVTWCFHRLDSRTRDLVRASENALRVAEARLAGRAGSDEINLVELSHAGRKKGTSYRSTFLILHSSAAIAFVAAALAALI